MSTYKRLTYIHKDNISKVSKYYLHTHTYKAAYTYTNKQKHIYTYIQTHSHTHTNKLQKHTYTQMYFFKKFTNAYKKYKKLYTKKHI